MKKTLALLLLVLSSCQTPIDIKPPTAPDGYKWVKILKNQSALLLPDGWFYKESHPKGTDAYFVTKENILKEGKFSTGLSLNVVYDIKKKTNITPSRYATGMILELYKNPSDEVLFADAKENGPFANLTCRIKNKKAGEEDVIVHYFYVANDKTETLWIFSFEAPEKEWDAAWETGSVMLKNLLIESEL